MSFLVLPLDDALLEQVERGAESRGWTLDVSRGTEQVIVSIAAGGDASELVESLGGGAQIDVVELRTREQYARRRARRRFLIWLVRAFGVLTAVGWVIPILGFLEPPPHPLSTPSLVRVATVGQLPPNTARRVRLNDRQVLLVHDARGHFFALDGRCTFVESCQLEWDPDLRRIACPCHGCQFDLYGNIVAGPPNIPLASHAVEQLGEHIYISRE